MLKIIKFYICLNYICVDNKKNGSLIIYFL